jgi:hypothetical protein
VDIQLRELQSRVRAISLDARSLSRLLESDVFKRAWTTASEAQKTQLHMSIASIDRAEVDRWVRRVLSVKLEDKSSEELRRIAQALGVSYYNSRTKEDLVKQIRKSRDESSGTGSQGRRDEARPPQGRGD